VSFWPLTIDSEEVSKQLLRQKHSLEVELCHERSKRQKVLGEAAELRKVTKEQEKTITSLRGGMGKRASHKSWQEYSRMHKHRRRKELTSRIKAMCKGGCFTPVSIEVAYEKENIDVGSGTATSSKRQVQLPKDLESFALYYVKDKFVLSDAAYRELTQLTPTIPRLSKLKALATSLNSECEIFPAPDGIIGVQQRLVPRLLLQLQNLDSLGADDVIRVKLTGDGTNVGRSVHVVNIAFTLLNDPSSVSSPSGNHSLAIFKISEDYDSLKTALCDVLKEAAELKSVEVNGNTHNIEYFLGGGGGDTKFLALVCGMEAVNASYACVWCKCPSSQRWDMSKSWSAFDSSNGAQTISEIESLRKKPKSQKMGCSRMGCSQTVYQTVKLANCIKVYQTVYQTVSNIVKLYQSVSNCIRQSKCVKL
jgi:hypothetical protein